MLELARAACGEFAAVGLESSLGTQATDRMVGEPTTFTKGWFDAFPDSADATPLLSTARAIKTAQEIERMRLANDIAAAATEHVRGLIRSVSPRPRSPPRGRASSTARGPAGRGRSSWRSGSR